MFIWKEFNVVKDRNGFYYIRFKDNDRPAELLLSDLTNIISDEEIKSLSNKYYIILGNSKNFPKVLFLDNIDANNFLKEFLSRYNMYLLSGGSVI